MAEIQTNTTGKKRKGFSKVTVRSTRVDLTPMVDLGFLLITFFIFTTALAKPTAMKLVMPDDKTPAKQATVSDEKTITLIVNGGNQLFYYFGVYNRHLTKIDFKQLRNVIIERKQQVFQKFRSPNIVVLIKVTNEAIFKNVVDSLDEMVINGVSTYMLLDPNDEELEGIKSAH